MLAELGTCIMIHVNGSLISHLLSLCSIASSWHFCPIGQIMLKKDSFLWCDFFSNIPCWNILLRKKNIFKVVCRLYGCCWSFSISFWLCIFPCMHSWASYFLSPWLPENLKEYKKYVRDTAGSVSDIFKKMAGIGEILHNSITVQNVVFTKCNSQWNKLKNTFLEWEGRVGTFLDTGQSFSGEQKERVGIFLDTGMHTSGEW